VLQQLAQAVDKTKPVYTILKEGNGEDTFKVCCKCLNETTFGKAITRKEAERLAAKTILKSLKKVYSKEYPKLFSNLKL
jgi:dsRNA-specific ribonuclease